MATRAQRNIEEMQAAQLKSIRQGGVVAACMEGRIWVTRDNDANDTVLEVGESFITTSRHRVILEALVPSRVVLQYPGTRERSIRLAFSGLLDSIKAIALLRASRLGLHPGK